MKGWRDGAGAAAGSFVPHCVVWITRNGKIAPNKGRTGKGHWRVLFNSHPSIHPYVTQVSCPCSAVNQVKSHSRQWGSQVSNVLFRPPYSQLRVGMDCKVMEFNSSQQQAQPRNSAGRIWDFLGWQREGIEWKSDLGFNEALMNGSQTTAIITQSPCGDTSLAGLRAARRWFTVESLLSWTRQVWNILFKSVSKQQIGLRFDVSISIYFLDCQIHVHTLLPTAKKCEYMWSHAAKKHIKYSESYVKPSGHIKPWATSKRDPMPVPHYKEYRKIKAHYVYCASWVTASFIVFPIKMSQYCS